MTGGEADMRFADDLGVSWLMVDGWCALSLRIMLVLLMRLTHVAADASGIELCFIFILFMLFVIHYIY